MANFASPEAEDAAIEASNAESGSTGRLSDQERAYTSANNALSDLYGYMYGKTYFGDEAKADVENMIRELLEVYDKRLANADWLTEETREYARKKLVTMEIRAGYADSLEDWWYTLDVSGETCAADMAVYLFTESFKHSLEDVGQPVDRS